MDRSHRRNREQRKTVLAAGKAQELPCCICGKAIDYDMPPSAWRDPWYPTLHHLDDVADGNPILTTHDRLGPAHNRCNSGLGAKNGSRKKKKKKNDLFEMVPTTPCPPVSVCVRNSRDIPFTLSANPREPGDLDGLPSFFTESHPDAVGSLGDEMVAHAEARRGGPLRWWQWVCAQRRYEVRADGSWCWPLVFESAPRQQGKSVTLAEDAAWFCGLPHDEPVEVLHAAHRVKTSLDVQADLWPWALERGLTVRQLLGDSKIIWPHGSVWATVAMESAYGRRPWRLLVDEAWALDPRKFWNSMFPALGARANPQVLFFSCANPDERGLISDLRADADVCRMEWGALPGEDPADPAVWRAASAFWSRGRDKLLALAHQRDGFAAEWLNVWPSAAVAASRGLVTADAWSQVAGVAVGQVVAAAVEAERGEPPVVAVVRRNPEGLVVSLRACSSVAAAVEVCGSLGVPPRVGKSLLAEPGWVALGAVPATGTGRDMAGEFRRLVLDGVLRHDGGELLGSLVAGWSGRPSDRVDGLKAAVWAARAARDGAEPSLIF